MAGTISALNGLAQLGFTVSMESGLDGRNNREAHANGHTWRSSQWSPA